MRFRVWGAALALAVATAAPAHVEVLRASAALPAHIAGSFREPFGFQQSDDGRYFVFDRRAHAVYSIIGGAAARIVDIGAEAGRVLDPTAFDVDPASGTFAVADAPLRQPRIQIFTATGGRIGGFTLPSKELPRVTIDAMVLSGIGSLQFTGRGVIINQPETGALIAELGLHGERVRGFGELRATGHEGEPDVHLALNTGFPLVDPTGGFYFVFAAGLPIFRKYDASGALVFERHIEGPELDDYVRQMPTRWPSHTTADGDVLPVVPPAVRTAGVDRAGRLWVALVEPFTYIYDPSGEKLRTVQFKGASLLTPNSLFFTKDGRVLVTPGCYEFQSPAF